MAVQFGIFKPTLEIYTANVSPIKSVGKPSVAWGTP